MVLIFGLALLLLSSIELPDAIVIILIVAIQVALGGSIWRRISGSSPVELAEFLGIGSAIGFSLSIVSSQIFREILPRSVAWLALPVVSLALSFFTTQHPISESVIAKEAVKAKPKLESSIIICGTLIALSASWYWLIPTALVCSGVVTWLLLQETFRSLGSKTYLLFKAMVIPLGYFCVRVFFDLTQVESIRNSNWWSFRLGVNDDPDLVFNESMIQSVQQFGTTDNIFFIGHPLKYHWVSFAWEATFESFRDLKPFAISGIVAPIITYFTIMSLVFALTRQISVNRFVPASSVALMSMMCAGPIPLFQILNPLSFSFNFSLIFVLAVLYMLAYFSFNLSITRLTLLSLLAFVAIGSKVTSLAGFAFGCAFLTVASLLINDSFRRFFRINMAFIFAVATFWLFGYRHGSGTSTARIRIDLGELVIQKANYLRSESVLVLTFGFIATIAAVFFSISGLMLLNSSLNKIDKVTAQFILISGAGVSILSVVIADDAESTGYLLGLGLAILLPLSVTVIGDYCTQNKFISIQLFFFAVLLGVIGSFVWAGRYKAIMVRGSDSQITRSLVVLIPLLIAVFLAISVFALGKENRFRKSLVAFAICLTSASGGSFLANASDFYSTGVTNRVGSDSIAKPYIGSDQYRLLLTWLKTNSYSGDLVATNRQCLEINSDPQNCLAFWSLTSAITGRQNLVEGLWPPFTENLSSERERRWKVIVEFVENPDAKNSDALIKYGVKWVVADHAITDTRSWEPFATERFKNLAGSILELNP